MRNIIVSIVLLISLFLSGCEVLTPNTSRAFSENQQMEALNQQTKQLERQADALEQLTKQLTNLAEQRVLSTENESSETPVN